MYLDARSWQVFTVVCSLSFGTFWEETDRQSRPYNRNEYDALSSLPSFQPDFRLFLNRTSLSISGLRLTCKDVAAGCLFVASKQEDTSKKAKDILIASYNMRHPNGPDLNPDSQVSTHYHKCSRLTCRHSRSSAEE